MNALIRFFAKYYVYFLFAILESIAIYLVVEHNNYQNAHFYNAAQNITGAFSKKVDALSQYLTLRSVNNQLARENTDLRNQLEKLSNVDQYLKTQKKDTFQQKYVFLTAKVINNSSSKQYNYITLDKGLKDGIEPEMGVVSADGIVGVVGSVSDNYCVVISLLNRITKVSIKFKKNNYFGSFEWPGKNYLEGEFKDVALHIKPEIGDTVITSGLAPTFPEGIMVGYVKDFKVKGANFYSITLKLSNDFRRLSYVKVLKNVKLTEQIKLENQIKND